MAQASKDSITVAPGERGDILTGNGEEEERSPEEPSPNGSEPRYAQRLFTEVRIPESQLQHTARAGKRG